MTTDADLARKKRRHRNERIAATFLVLLLAAGVAMLATWNEEQQEEMDRNKLYIPKPNQITPDLLLLREYVRIDTSTPEGAATGARWLTAYLAKHGVQAELIESTPGRLNVYARVRGRERGNALMLFNHIDVVPPGPDWKHPPFEGVMQANMLHGRGTLDMKALAICQLLAFIDVARAGKPPRHDLIFLATAEEEQGSEHGMKWLLAHRADVFEGVTLGITEGGITEMMTEEMSYFGIEVGGKQLVRLDMVGKDIESVQRLRIALEPQISSREPERIPPDVAQFFRDVAPTRLAYREMLADIDGTVRAGAFWKLPPAYRDLTQNTVWASAPWRSGNDGWGISVNLVNLPDEDPDRRIAMIRSIGARFGVETRVVSKEGPVKPSTPDTPLFRILVDEARKRYRVHAGTNILYRSLSDARLLRPRGIVCYGICPYRVDFFQSLTIHKANERIRMDWFTAGVGYTRDVVGRWAFGGQ